MEIRYYKEWSGYLNRDMEFKVYGHGGRPMVIFPCQGGRFWDWEDRHMHELAARWIDASRLQLFCVDSIDKESWDCPGGDCRHRSEMQERWYNYICEEFYPRMMEINRADGGDFEGRALVGGASMGAGHAVNFYLRRPELFNGTIALSGLYDSRDFFGDYMDDLVYRNTPCVYMRNFPADHPYVSLYNTADKFCICVGQGSWEEVLLQSTRELEGILTSKGIHAHVEYWGNDVSHDWCWWEKQWQHFLGTILG